MIRIKTIDGKDLEFDKLLAMMLSAGWKLVGNIRTVCHGDGRCVTHYATMSQHIAEKPVYDE